MRHVDDESARISPRPWRALLEVGVLAVVTTAVLCTGSSPGPRYPDEVDYWHLGQSVAAGRGFTTRMIRPLELSLHPATLFTDVTRPPGMPLLVAGEQKVFGPGWHSRQPMVSLAFLVLALAQWGLGRTLAGPGAGRIAWALTLFNPTLLFYGGLLLSEIPFCTTVSIMLAVTVRMRSSAWRALLVGGCIGVAFLTRAVALLYLPALLYATRKESSHRTRDVVLLLAAALAPSLPWLIRNWVVVGRPMLGFNSLQLPMFTASWPGYSLFRTVEGMPPAAFAISHPEQLTAKWIHGLRVGTMALATQGGIGILLLAGASTLRTAHRIRVTGRTVLLAVALFLVVLPFYEPRDRHYLPLAVWTIPLASVMIASLMRHRILGAIVLVLLGGEYAHRQGHQPDPPPLAWSADAESALEALPEGTIVATDAPWVVTLASPHRSIWIPQDEAAWEICRRTLPDLNAIYLTRELLSWPPAQRPRLWAGLYTAGGGFEGGVPPRTFSDGSRLWVTADRE